MSNGSLRQSLEATTADAREALSLIEEDQIAAELAMDRALAFRLVHDAEWQRILKDAGLSTDAFTKQLWASVTSIVAEQGRQLTDHERVASLLIVASVMRWGGGSRSWLAPGSIGTGARIEAVEAMQSGRFDAARGVSAGFLRSLVLNRTASWGGGHAAIAAALASDAVNAGLRAACGAAGIPLAAQLNLCVVHAAMRMGEDPGPELGDLLDAAGLDRSSFDRMVEELRTFADPVTLRAAPARFPDLEALDRIPEFRNAVEWLGFAFDREFINSVRAFEAEIPSMGDPWVAWMHRQAISGSSGQGVFRMLQSLGERRKDRATVLAAAAGHGFIVGDAIRVFESEFARVAPATDEAAAFRQLFTRRCSMGDASIRSSQLAEWYRRTEAAYLANANSLRALPSVAQALEEAERAGELPDELRALAEKVISERGAREEAAAEAAGKGWLWRLVNRCATFEFQPDEWDGGRRVLTDSDRTDLRKLVGDMRNPRNSRWYDVKLDGSAERKAFEFRLAEAAYATGLMPEDAFKRRIKLHSQAVWDSDGLSEGERQFLRDLFSRCGRHMLGRLRDSQPRAATLEAFRLGDARGMLAAEARGGASAGPQLPHDGEPVGARNWMALVAAGLAVLLVGCFLAAALLGVDRAPTAAARSAAPVPTPSRNDVMTLDSSWKFLGSGRWGRIVSKEELDRYLPAGQSDASGATSRGAACDYRDRFAASIGGHRAVRLPDSTDAVVGTLKVAAPTAVEAGRLADQPTELPWSDSDAALRPLERRRVAVVIVVPTGGPNG